MRLFLFAIGGTGARVVRSLTMMLASGIKGLDSSVEIVPLIIDYDLSNADKARAISALEKYSEIHQSLYADAINKGKIFDDHFFMTSITPLRSVGNPKGNGNNLKADYEIYFAPIGKAIKFTDYLDLSNMQANTSEKTTFDLLNALYDNSDQNDKNAELNLELTVGFKGRPNVGSVVFHELRSSEEMDYFFRVFDPDNDRVFIVSSIFGGTGSSGFPEIVNAIRNHANPQIKNSLIGSAIILPYFGLGKPDPQTDDKGAIDPSEFPSKTVAALSYYDLSGLNQQIDALYYVGDENIDAYDYHEGSTLQENRAHVVEFVAATSIINFIKRKSNNFQRGNAYEYGIVDEKKGEAIQLPDFYPESHTSYLDNLSVFAFAMKYYRDVICGDRKKISTSTAFYAPKGGFDLESKLKNGFYQKLNEFVDKDYNDGNKGHWGFYPWLHELASHVHKLFLYNVDAQEDMKNFLTHKTVANRRFFAGTVADDGNITSSMNKKNKNLTERDDSSFMKILREVSTEIYNEIKKD